jgi:cytochrome c553
MTDFRDGTRGNNPGMSDLMKATSMDAIIALAEYLAGIQIDQYLGGQGHQRLLRRRQFFPQRGNRG